METLTEIYKQIGKFPFWARFLYDELWKVTEFKDGRFCGETTEIKWRTGNETKSPSYILNDTSNWKIDDKTYKDNFDEIMS